MTPADDLRTTPKAERAVIGCVLREPAWATDEAARLLRPDDFLGYVERQSFEAIQSLAADGVRAELVAVFERLQARGQADCVGGQPGGLVAWLTTTWEDTPTPVHLEHYAKLVRDAAAARALAATAEELRRDAGDRIEPAADTAARFADRLAGLAAGRDDAGEATAAEAVLAGLADLRRRHTTADRAGRVRFGFAGLDDLMPSLDPGTVVVVAAHTGLGKTAFALNVTALTALRGLPVYFVSLEMDRAELGQRLAFSAGGLRGGALRAGRGSDQELERMAAVADELTGLPLAISDTAGLTVEYIVARARLHQRKRGLALLVVDYLQLVRPTDRKAPRLQQVEHISRSLKIAAKAMQVPVLALAQLNREAESRPGGRPTVANIREADGIGHDADGVVLLSPDPDQPTGGTDLRVRVEMAKSRNGAVGETTLLFRRGCVRFEDIPP